MKKKKKEVWKLVKGYEDKLAVSNHGRVCRPEIRLPNGTKQEMLIRKPYTHHTGYQYTLVYKDGKQHYLSIHRLVAEAFIPNPDNLSEVNHKDFDKENNYVTNLEWVTREQNMQHTSELMRQIQKVNSNSKGTIAKPVRAIDREGVVLTFESVNSCIKSFASMERSGILSCPKGRLKTYKGYRFEYINEE